MKTYTLAKRDAVADSFNPINNIPTNMTLAQANIMAQKARDNGFDVVVFNVGAE